MATTTHTRQPDIALERGLPANLDAERFVLGALLLDDALFSQIAGAVEPEDFSVERHRRIFLRMGEVYRRGERIDRVTVANELKRLNQLDQDGISYLCSLDDGLPVISNIAGYVRIVSEKATLRRLIFAARSMADRCIMEQDSPGELLVDGERILRELGSRVSSRGNLESASAVIQALDVNAIGKIPPSVIRTPYSGLNRRIVGMFPGELHVIGARPSAGKSVEAVETALCAAEHGHPVALFSLEMRKQAILVRAACNRGQVDNSQVRHGRMSQVERYDFMQALTAIQHLPLYIDDKSHTFAAMAAEVRKMPVRPRLMIVDHLHLMRTIGRHENRNNELAAITRDLKLFAGEMDMTVKLLAQLSRANEKENRSPEMRDLRDCGSIEADADVITFLHRKEQMSQGDHEGPVEVDMLLAKQREGVSLKKIPFLLVGKFYKLMEVDNGST